MDLDEFWKWVEQKNHDEIQTDSKILKFRTDHYLSKTENKKCIELEYISSDGCQMIAIFTHNKEIIRCFSYRKNNTGHVIKSCISVNTVIEILQYFFCEFFEIKEPE
jgi:hypothetical protein